MFESHERVRLRRPDGLYIGGQWREASAAADLVSPSDEAVHSRVAAATAADVDRAVAAARQAFDEGPWPRMSAAERAGYMRKFAAGLRARADAFAAAWSLQTGIPITIAAHGLADPGRMYDYYADLIERENLVTVHRRDNGGHAIVAREPVGVVAAVTPWNHPSHLMALKAAPAMAMGCAIVGKPAPESPLDMFLYAEVAEDIGLPPGVFNMVPCGREASDHLVRHPGIDKVSFTGSAATGAHIASVCASRMARSSMELGGKSAAIVLDDMPVETVVATLVDGGGVRMCGQGCAFLTRVLVSRKRRDELADAYAAKMREVVIGHAFEPSVQMGPVAMRRQLDKIMGYIEQGKAQGARIVTGGGRPDHLVGVPEGKGFFVEPTLFVDVTNEMAIAREEVFGPVISMIAWDDEAEAIRLANDSPYGLNGAVYTQDADKAWAIARRIRSGNFSQNGLEHDSMFPFGGYKLSGTGREGGPWGLDAYTEIKTIYMPHPPAAVA
ncbi:MAG: aldehyde dehydrogenase [Novosphingobium sp.]|nr:aldehyde dehydrogenase [Novosphingobium sp.]